MNPGLLTSTIKSELRFKKYGLMYSGLLFTLIDCIKLYIYLSELLRCVFLLSSSRQNHNSVVCCFE